MTRGRVSGSIFAVVLACAFALGMQSCLAQAMNQTLSGTVVDASQHPIPNATITFIGSQTIAAQSTSDGTFSVLLPPGLYRVVATAKGFEIARRDSVLVGDQAMNVQIKLLPNGSLKVIANVSTTTQSEINVTPVAITRLTSSAITSQGSIGIARVLAEIPGVQITATSAGSVNTVASEYAINSPADPVAIGIRGSQPYENAVLFDGHRISSNLLFGGGTGHGVFNFANLDPYSFFTLDVIRGPGAASPTINNSIGGTANIDPGVPSGAPSGTVSYGFDGSGGLLFNVSAEGETRNKRVALGISMTSNAIPGPINGFPIINLGNNFFLAALNGNQLFSCLSQPCSQVIYPSTPADIAGLPQTTQVSAIACCATKATQDYINSQQRSVNIKYDIAPTVELRIRYGVNNQLVNYNETPVVNSFIPPAGYHGKYANAFQFYSVFLSLPIPSREIDQLYEYDVRARVGNGSVRASYASYLSTNSQQLHSASFNCNNCVISGEATVGGVFDPNTSQVVGGTPTIFNDQTATLSSYCNGNSNVYLAALTHDFIAEAVYPLGKNIASLSYNVTSLTNIENDTIFTTYDNSITPFPPFTYSQQLPGGEYENFGTIRARLDSPLGKHVSSQIALYANQYQYHVLDPSDPTQQRFTDTYSHFTVPRFSLEWCPDADIAVRASTGGGIAPVDISNLIGQNGIPFPNAQPPQFYTVSLANPNLKPETSWGEDLGISVRLPDRISTASVDVYSTTLHGQFFSNEQQIGLYQNLPLYATQTLNLGHSRYMGVEFAYSRHPASGLFFTLQGSLQRGYAYDVPASFYTSQGGPYSTNLTIIPNENFDGGMSGIGRTPYAQGFSSLGWQSRKGFETNVNITYYGNNNAFYRPPFFTVDLNGNVPVARNMSLGIVLANVTNIYPSLFYTTPQYAIVPFVHSYFGFIGAATAVQNVGPRHLSAILNIRL